MSMLDNLFGSHVNNLERSLSLARQRHAAISSNLANVNTPGYKRQDVDFNIQLEGAMGSIESKIADLNGDPTQRDNAMVRVDGNSVDVEKEVMALAETEMRYTAIADLTASYFAGLKNVIREGR